MYDGVLIPSSRSPRVIERTTMVPLRPYITRLGAQIRIDPERGTITIGLPPAEIVMHLGSLRASSAAGPFELRAAPFLADDTIYLPLAAIARALGERVSYAPALHTVLVEGVHPAPLTSMTPFDPAVPQAVPTQIFTAEPKRVERPAPSGTPRPRRTPLAATPSWPQIAP